MNAHLQFLAATARVDETTVQPLPHSRKVDVEGSRPDIRVPMCGRHFCSMKINPEVRGYVSREGISHVAALKQGMQAGAVEFVKNRAEIYHKQRA
jgi:hypothetical protein